jgi:hypothetical protein
VREVDENMETPEEFLIDDEDAVGHTEDDDDETEGHANGDAGETP